MKAAAILATLLVLTLTTAHGLTAQCTPTTTTPQLDTGDTPQGRYYYVEDCAPWRYCPTDVLYSAWTYQESNGIDGLQRDDAVRDDTCGGIIAGDTIIL